MNTLAKFVGWVAVSLICSLGSAQVDTGNANAEIEALIQQLAEPSFQSRQQATTRLIEIGSSAEHQLGAALESNAPEVQARCRIILETIFQDQAAERRDAFLAGNVGRLKQNAESWKRFENLIGNSEESRKLFVDLQLSHGVMLDMLEDELPCSELIDELCRERIKSIGSGSKEADRSLVASIAFVGSQAQLESIANCRGTSAVRLYGETYGKDEQILRLLVAAWASHGARSKPTIRLLYLADEFELDESVELARALLEKSNSSTLVLSVIASRGNVADVKHLEPLIDSAKSIRKVQGGDDKISLTKGDLALAACVKLSGQDLAEYGFSSPAEEIDFNSRSFGFKNLQRRENALTKWRAFRRNQPGKRPTSNSQTTVR